MLFLKLNVSRHGLGFSKELLFYNHSSRGSKNVTCQSWRTKKIAYLLHYVKPNKDIFKKCDLLKFNFQASKVMKTTGWIIKF